MRLSILVIGAFTILAVKAALAAPPEILQAPTPERFLELYPTLARDLSIPGSAVLKCVIGADHRPSQCAIIEERPAGLGFGAAALTMAPDFLMSDSVSVGSPFSRRIKFIQEMDGETVPTSPTPVATAELQDLARKAMVALGGTDLLRFSGMPDPFSATSNILERCEKAGLPHCAALATAAEDAHPPTAEGIMLAALTDTFSAGRLGELGSGQPSDQSLSRQELDQLGEALSRRMNEGGVAYGRRVLARYCAAVDCDNAAIEPKSP